MRRLPALFLVIFYLAGCSPRGGAPRGPGSAGPVADPRSSPGVAATGGGTPAAGAPGDAEGRSVPVRADQAPLVSLREALVADSLLGRRVRVAGRCVARGEGRRAGSWTMDDEGATIEVRGLVPSTCAPHGGEPLTIFAQIEPKARDSQDRILLRLPD